MICFARGGMRGDCEPGRARERGSHGSHGEEGEVKKDVKRRISDTAGRERGRKSQRTLNRFERGEGEEEQTVCMPSRARVDRKVAIKKDSASSHPTPTTSRTSDRRRNTHACLVVILAPASLTTAPRLSRTNPSRGWLYRAPKAYGT